MPIILARILRGARLGHLGNAAIARLYDRDCPGLRWSPIKRGFMAQLVWQLAVGSLLMALATGIQTLFIGVAISMRPHLVRRIGSPALWPFTLLVTGVALWMLLGQTVGVWIWAIALFVLGAFEAFEPSLYYSLSAYTTVGFGDVLPTENWRLMGTMAGANGMLAFGLAAAALVNLVGNIRRDLGEDI